MVSVGANLPCVTKNWAESRTDYHSKGEGGTNRVTMGLGGVCNVGTNNDMESNQFTVEIDIASIDHPDIQNGTKEWLFSAGCMYTENILWVGVSSMYLVQGTAINPTTPPYVALEKVSSFPETLIGYPTDYRIIIKVPPLERLQLVVNISTLDPALSICGLRVEKAGDNLPCVDTETVPFHSDDNSIVSLDLAVVTNHGNDTMASNTYFDSNTLILRASVKLNSNADHGFSYDFLVQYTYSTNGAPLSLPLESVTATSDNSSISGISYTQPTANFTVGAIAGNDTDQVIFVGGSKRVIADVVLAEGAVSFLDVEFSVVDPDNDMEICVAAASWAGVNVPCIDKLQAPVFGPSQMTANLRTGFVCNSPVKSNDVNANTVRYEAVVALLPDSTATVGNTKVVNVKITDESGSVIFVHAIEFAVADADTYNDTYQNLDFKNDTLVAIAAPNGPIGIGEKITLQANVTIPANSSSKVAFDVELPNNESAVMTVEAIRLIHSSRGRNIACLHINETTSVSFRSLPGNCQNNYAILNFGIVTNHGLTYRQGFFEENDNNIEVEFDVRMVDNILADHATSHNISVGIKTAGWIVIVDSPVSVTRNGTEKPDILLTAEVDFAASNNTYYEIIVTMEHSNTSTAEAYNLSAFFYVPPYTPPVFLTHSNSTTTGKNKEDYAPLVKEVLFDEFMFCDKAQLKLAIESNSSFKVPNEFLGGETYILFEATCDMISRVGNADSVTFFRTPMQKVNVSISMNGESVCSDPLGMENGGIKDCQIRSSDESLTPATLGRANGTGGWEPHTRGDKFKRHRFIQVYFGNRTTVTKIAIQSTAANHPKEIQTQYSEDGKAWVDGEIKLLSGVSDNTVMLTKARESRYIRVYFTKDNMVPATDPAMMQIRVEFYGCQNTDDVAASDVCSSVFVPDPVPADYCPRSFVVAGQDVFVCDANPDEDLKPTCVKSGDGSTWNQLDQRLGGIVGYDNDDNKLYVYANDKKSMMMSDDNGVKWYSVYNDDAVQAKAKVNFRPATCVPWNLTATAYPLFTMDSWGARYDGMMHYSGSNWDSVTNWQTCCT